MLKEQIHFIALCQKIYLIIHFVILACLVFLSIAHYYILRNSIHDKNAIGPCPQAESMWKAELETEKVLI